MTQRFGEMLLARRRQMGVSLQQAANVIKMRPQIIEYFETENFAAMPPRGYAQGMIASYARFLGLNPTEVVDAYFDALHEYEHSGGRAGRFQEAAFDPNPRSSQLAGRYHMLEPERPSSRFAQRPPQAGYVGEGASSHEPMSASRLRPASIADRRRPGAGRPGYDPSQRSRTRVPRNGAAEAPAYGRAPHAGRGGAYAPQGRYADMPRGPREQAPQRRQRPDGSGQNRGGGRPPQGGGLDFSRLPFDPKFLIMGLVGILVIIALAAMLLMRGCAPKEAVPAGSSTSEVTKVEKQDDASEQDDAATDDSADTTDDVDDDGSEKDDKPKVTVPEKTVVKVKVKGSEKKDEQVVAWVEVNLDGKSVLGKQVVGPFEQEFEVTQQIDITTDSPSNVTVYKNGKKVRYDTKVSGVAKVSIAAPKIETVDLTVDIDDDGVADMTSEDALNAGYDVEARTVDTRTIPLHEYAYATDGEDADASADSSADTGTSY